MVDPERVTRLLAHVLEAADFLDGFRGTATSELLPDPIRLGALKYAFVTGIQGCARVAHHLSVSEGWGAPDSNADAFRLLGAHGVLPPGLQDATASASGFRNVLVHQYTDVDNARVVAHLDDVDDLRSFVQHVSAWLDRQSG